MESAGNIDRVRAGERDIFILYEIGKLNVSNELHVFVAMRISIEDAIDVRSVENLFRFVVVREENGARVAGENGHAENGIENELAIEEGNAVIFERFINNIGCKRMNFFILEDGDRGGVDGEDTEP